MLHGFLKKGPFFFFVAANASCFLFVYSSFFSFEITGCLLDFSPPSLFLPSLMCDFGICYIFWDRVCFISRFCKLLDNIYDISVESHAFCERPL